MRFKVCIVPRCQNTSENQPEKLFVRVPTNLEARERWKRALHLTKDLPKHSKYCCCEDHFNLAEDCTNWSYFRTVGKYLSLKPHVIPHLYIEHAPPDMLKPQMSGSMKKRKAELVESVVQREHSKRQLFIERDEEPDPLAIPSVNIEEVKIESTLRIEQEKDEELFIKHIIYKPCSSLLAIPCIQEEVKIEQLQNEELHIKEEVFVENDLGISEKTFK